MLQEYGFERAPLAHKYLKNMDLKAPKARFITAWGEAPGDGHRRKEGLKARPIPALRQSLKPQPTHDLLVYDHANACKGQSLLPL